MALFALIIGVILIVSAVRNSHAALFSALVQDVPPFVVWGAAILAIGAIGFIPGLKGISRLLLALVLIVIIVNNYQKIVAGFSNAAKTAGSGQPANAANTSNANIAHQPVPWDQALTSAMTGNPIE